MGRNLVKVGDRKRQLAETHIKERNSRRGVQLTTQYVYLGCKKEFSSFISAGRHARPYSGSLSSSNLRQSLELTIASAMDGSQGSPNPVHSPLPSFSPSRIEGDKIILKYPEKPTKCPRCEWTTLATNTRAMGCIHRHLETPHKLRLVKYWECGVCGFSGDSPTLKGHPIRFAGIPSMDGN